MANITINHASITSTSGNDTIIAGQNSISNTKSYSVNGNGGDDLIDFSTSTANDTLISGSGNSTILGGSGKNTFIDNGGTDNITAGAGADIFKIHAGIGNIFNASGSETLIVSAHAQANLTPISKWTASAQSINNGIVDISTNGYAIDVSKAGGNNGWSITNTGGATTLTGGMHNDSLTAGANGDTLIDNGGYDTFKGGLGADTFIVKKAGTAIIDPLNNSDTLVVGKFSSAHIDTLSNWTATSSTINNGATSIIAVAGASIDLSKATGSNGFTINGEAGNDSIVGSAQNNVLIGGSGDILSGGAGRDKFIFIKDFGGATAADVDTITNFQIGSKADSIVYLSANLKIGASDTAVTINKAGVASFSNAPASLTTAITELATAFDTNHKNAAGKFAFFQINNSGPEYLYISGGNETTPGSADNVIELTGITSIQKISVIGDHLSIIS